MLTRNDLQPARADAEPLAVASGCEHTTRRFAEDLQVPGKLTVASARYRERFCNCLRPKGLFIAVNSFQRDPGAARSVFVESHRQLPVAPQTIVCLCFTRVLYRQ